MAGLSWHSGAAHHRRALDQFVCTDPPKRRYDPHRGRIHPRPYELEVQSHLHGLRLPPTRGEALLVGVDDRGMSATAHFGVFTHIDPRNDASRALFRSAGFEFLGRYDGYEGWVRDI